MKSFSENNVTKINYETKSKNKSSFFFEKNKTNKTNKNNTITSYNNINNCNNCGKSGHVFHQCKMPITSIGIIVFRIVPNNDSNKMSNELQYLLIRRKDTLGYIDFMRGKYSIYNKNYIINMLKQMTNDEKKLLCLGNFDLLWKNIWGDSVNNQYRTEEIISREKYKILLYGVNNNFENYTLQSLIEESNQYPCWEEPEWGFPKGRRNNQENDYDCAVREFSEETGYFPESLVYIQNILPFEEIFTGSNYKSYKHKYFVGIINNAIIPINNFQINEISEIKWVPIDDVYSYIRDYNYEKTNIINDLNKLLKTYRLYI